jgi:hypothetical protein
MSFICPALVQYFLSNGASTWFDELTTANPELVLSLRVIRSTENSVFDVVDPATNLPIPDLDQLRALAPFIIPLFQGPRLIFHSAERYLGALAGHDRVHIACDYSLSFDTNVGKTLRAYVFGSNLGAYDKSCVIQLIGLIKRHQWHIDIQPCLAEDFRHAEIEGNERPLNTLIAFRMLEYLDVPAFLDDPETPRFIGVPASLRDEAARDFHNMLNLSASRKHETRALGTYALLLELAELWLAEPKEAERNFSRLIDFSLFDLGRFAKLELSFAWDFLREPHTVRFFGPLRGFSVDLLEQLRRMAWDFVHYRLLLERMLIVGRSGVFHVPIFVAFDKRWAELMKTKPVEIHVMHQATETSDSLFAGEFEFHLAVNGYASREAVAALTDRNLVAARVRTPADRSALTRLIASLEARVSRLAQARRDRRPGGLGTA